MGLKCCVIGGAAAAVGKSDTEAKGLRGKTAKCGGKSLNWRVCAYVKKIHATDAAQQQLEKAHTHSMCVGGRKMLSSALPDMRRMKLLLFQLLGAHPPSRYYLGTRDGFGFCESGFKSQV